MLQTAAPLFSRMIESKSLVAIPPNSSHINHSTNTSFFRQGAAKGYSLKFVLSGIEKYEVNRQRFTVGKNQFLIVAHDSEIIAEIKSDKIVEGFCFYLNTEQVKDVWTNLNNRPENLLANKDIRSDLPVFYESIFNADHSAIGKKLQMLAFNVRKSSNPEESLTEEIFYNLAQDLCLLQAESLKQLALLPAHKTSTREELYRRVCQARDYMHDNFSISISLADLAEISNLSEFHFLRTFKAAFGESPYQYLLKLRLEYAKNLLLHGNYNISETALLCGFKEGQTFGKMFRKYIGVNPNEYRKSR